jgi:hypothetical protein
VSSQHKAPFAAFVVVAVACLVLIVQAIRTDALPALLHPRASVFDAIAGQYLRLAQVADGDSPTTAPATEAVPAEGAVTTGAHRHRTAGAASPGSSTHGVRASGHQPSAAPAHAATAAVAHQATAPAPSTSAAPPAATAPVTAPVTSPGGDSSTDQEPTTSGRSHDHSDGQGRSAGHGTGSPHGYDSSRWHHRSSHADQGHATSSSWSSPSYASPWQVTSPYLPSASQWSGVSYVPGDDGYGSHGDDRGGSSHGDHGDHGHHGRD